MWACGYEVGSDTGANGATSLFEPDSLGVNPRSLDFRLPRFLSVEGHRISGGPYSRVRFIPRWVPMCGRVGMWWCGRKDTRTRRRVGIGESRCDVGVWV
jgi:hypothetical protein